MKEIPHLPMNRKDGSGEEESFDDGSGDYSDGTDEYSDDGSGDYSDGTDEYYDDGSGEY